MAKNWVQNILICSLFKLLIMIFRDQFILEANGYGRIVGRIKEMIIRGGENIYPKEIEDFLQTHPDILEAYVCRLFNFVFKIE